MWNTPVVIVLLCVQVLTVHCVQQVDLDYIGASLDVKVTIVDNLKQDGAKHLFQVVLTNTGNRVISQDKWAIYFYSFFFIEPYHSPSKEGYVVPHYHIKVKHIKGCLFSMEPTTNFRNVEISERRLLEFYGKFWAVSKTDVPPNWYVTAAGLKPVTISATRTGNNFLTTMDAVRQWKRYRGDMYNPYTPQERYRRYQVRNHNSHGDRVIPSPKMMKSHEGNVNITTWTIVATAGLQFEAQYLKNRINISSSTAEEIPSPQTKKTIFLSTNHTASNNDEWYSLNINATSETITVIGRNSSGVFYGIQTLLSLTEDGKNMILSSVLIVDEPRFHFRGMYLDVARNFQSKDSVLKLLQVMGKYKLNRFHIHLADDEGWRLEIPGLPELTEVGSKRCHDLMEEHCLISQLGSGPDNSTSGSGFFTVSDYKEIVKYAEDRHIEIIPEIESPAHSRAAIISMEARYRRYKATNMTKATQYRLVDPQDTSEYTSNQMFNDNVVNPCIESTYAFFEKIITEIHKMQPSVKVYHFGGDEAPKHTWINSTACQTFAARDSYYKNPKHLKEHFTRRLSNITDELGLNLGGWEDGFMDQTDRPFYRPFLVNKEVYANAWQNVWEWGFAKRAYNLANNGYKVIMSHATHLYFDHPYEPDPEERGLYWATRCTDTFKTFRFMPDNLYENIDYKRSGEPLTRQDVCGVADKKCPALQQKNRQNIIGMQGHLWSETVFTSDFLEYMIFPRMLALSERAWHKASWEDIDDKVARDLQMDADWEMFSNAVGHKELPRLSKLGMKYRITPPGAIVKDGVLSTNNEFPGLENEYSRDDGKTWNTLPHDFRIPHGDTFLLRTRSDDGKRVSRAVKFTSEERIRIPSQQSVNYIASNLDTTFEVLDNLVNEYYNYSCRYTFTNNGNEPIKTGNWSVYFHNIRLVQADNFPYPDGYHLEDCKMTIFHVAGSLYRFAPSPTFQLPSLSSTSCLIYAKYWQVASTDTMPNWYIEAEGMGPKVIKSTLGNSLSFVKPFVRQGQVQRYPSDRFGFYLPRTRFAYNSDIKDSGNVGKPVIPTPVHINVEYSKTVTIDSTWTVLQSQDFPKAVSYFSDLFNITSQNVKPVTKYIEFVKENISALGNNVHTEAEAYTLNIDAAANRISIKASSEAGAFNAIQTMRQMVVSENGALSVPECNIEDQPRFEYRGMHIDVGRNFKNKSEVLKFLDAMALYKMNKFHFHLTEDEGWRIEIPGLEELTTVGSKRCHDPHEDDCTVPQLGSNPNGGEPGSGFYSVEDYRDILRYANERHIQVIPEIDMPGHCRAGIKAMEARYRKYMKYGNRTAAEEYLLTELGDKSEYLTVQWFTDNAVNPCLTSTFSFISHVIKNFVKMHSDIQPLKLYHFGADEVARGAWEKSDACKQLIQNTSGLNSIADLKRYFGYEISKLTAAEGLDIGAWEDGLMNHDNVPYDINNFPNPPRRVYGYAWSNIWEYGNGDRAYKLANAGYKVILSHATHLFLDHPYEPDSKERGYYWATRFTDTRKVFGYIPDNIYANADIDGSGAPLTPEQICPSGSCLKLDHPENIEGIQGQSWGETIRTAEDMDAMIFPRMLALAERAWHKSAWEDIEDKTLRNKQRDSEWQIFANTLGHKHLQILEKMDIRYRLPVPGARVSGNTIDVNVAFPGLVIQLSTDNQNTWSDVIGMTILMDKDGTVHLRTLSTDRQRSSRVISVDIKGITPTSNTVRNLMYNIFIITCLLIHFICVV